jgi:hypothetical protein
VYELHLEIDAMNVVFGGPCLRSRARTPLVGTQLRYETPVAFAVYAIPLVDP